MQEMLIFKKNIQWLNISQNNNVSQQEQGKFYKKVNIVDIFLFCRSL